LELNEKNKVFAAIGKEKEHVLPIFSAKSENDIANLHECKFKKKNGERNEKNEINKQTC